MTGRKVTISSACFLFMTLPAQCQNLVREVVIDSSWKGLGLPSKAHLLVGREGGDFTMDGKKLDASLLESLVAALRQPRIVRPDASVFGVTPEWLDQNADIAGQQARGYDYKNAAPNQKALFRAAFTNFAAINAILSRASDLPALDDEPQFTVALDVENSKAWSVRSDSSGPFLLPWHVKMNGEEFTTYNPNISQAVAALMPEKTVNRDRISGARFMGELAELVLHQIGDQWKLLDVMNRADQELALLRSKYVVKNVEIHAGGESGRPWSENNLSENNLYAVLSREGFPKNFSVGVVLLYQGDRVRGTEEFLRDALKYETLVLSVPWLSQYLAAHPMEEVDLHYVHDRSLNERAMSAFSADMRAAGKDRLVAEVDAVRDRAALLVTKSQDYWIVLPDRRMILWLYSDLSAMNHNGSLKLGNIQTHDCVDYHRAFGGCVGAVLTPDGILVK